MKKLLHFSKRKNSKKDRFEASMILAAVGDSLGYKNGNFEFCFKGKKIIEHVEKLGGLESIDTVDWNLSDDSIMHIATAKGLIQGNDGSIDEILTCIAKEYIDCWSDMKGRSPGMTCAMGVGFLERGKKWNEIPYNSHGGGCGGSMRSSCIGLMYNGKKNRDKLIAISIEAGRLTHNHPTGFLGSLTSSVFTAFAIENIPSIKWGYLLLNEIIPKAKEYIKEANRDLNKGVIDDMDHFINQFSKFMDDRKINSKDASLPFYPNSFKDDVAIREEYWKEFSYAGWPGASGDDSCIIAYDCILLANSNYKKVVEYSCFHGGDSDSTGTIALALFGAQNGFDNTLSINHKNIEYRKEIESLATQLFKLNQKITKQ